MLLETYIYISDCIPKNVPADSCKLVIYFLGKKRGGGGIFNRRTLGFVELTSPEMLCFCFSFI